MVEFDLDGLKGTVHFPKGYLDWVPASSVKISNIYRTFFDVFLAFSMIFLGNSLNNQNEILSHAVTIIFSILAIVSFILYCYSNKDMIKKKSEFRI